MKELFEIKPTKQMEIFNQELTKIHKAGFTGKEAFQEALAIAGRKVNSGKKTRSRVHFQLRWNFGRPDLPGQKYLNLTGGGDGSKEGLPSKGQNPSGPQDR